jgi:DNA-binding CsgD family transcriptional regulator
MVKVTRTEREVLLLLREGLNSTEAADKKMCSVRTVRWHEMNLREKFKVHSRTAVLRQAELLGVFDDDY